MEEKKKQLRALMEKEEFNQKMQSFYRGYMKAEEEIRKLNRQVKQETEVEILRKEIEEAERAIHNINGEGMSTKEFEKLAKPYIEKIRDNESIIQTYERMQETKLNIRKKAKEFLEQVAVQIKSDFPKEELKTLKKEYTKIKKEEKADPKKVRDSKYKEYLASKIKKLEETRKAQDKEGEQFFKKQYADVLKNFARIERGEFINVEGVDEVIGENKEKITMKKKVNKVSAEKNKQKLIEESKPVEESTPAEEPIQVEEFTPVEAQIPVEEITSEEEVTPVEEIISVEEVTSVEEMNPVEEVAPVEEFTTVEEQAEEPKEIKIESITCFTKVGYYLIKFADGTEIGIDESENIGKERSQYVKNSMSRRIRVSEKLQTLQKEPDYLLMVAIQEALYEKQRRNVIKKGQTSFDLKPIDKYTDRVLEKYIDSIINKQMENFVEITYDNLTDKGNVRRINNLTVNKPGVGELDRWQKAEMKKTLKSVRAIEGGKILGPIGTLEKIGTFFLSKFRSNTRYMLPKTRRQEVESMIRSMANLLLQKTKEPKFGLLPEEKRKEVAEKTNRILKNISNQEEKNTSIVNEDQSQFLQTN